MTGMSYWAVEAAKDQHTVHIMESKTPYLMGAFEQILLGPGNKFTLCSKRAVRWIDVFTPEEATCAECLKRYTTAG